MGGIDCVICTRHLCDVAMVAEFTHSVSRTRFDNCLGHTPSVSDRCTVCVCEFSEMVSYATGDKAINDGVTIYMMKLRIEFESSSRQRKVAMRRVDQSSVFILFFDLIFFCYSIT